MTGRARLRSKGLHLAALLAVILVLALSPARLLAAEQVAFLAATMPPSALQLRIAKAEGRQPVTQAGVPLRGRLSRPAGPGPFPAVVLLHGCAGVEPYQDAWAELLAQWGYVALQVDSIGSRGLGETCTLSEPESDTGDVVMDAFGAHAYLRTLPYIDPDRIAVLGWSYGATRALGAVEESGPHQFVDGEFGAAVALYPACARTGGRFVAPVKVLIGAEDDWSPSARCALFAEASQGGPNPVDLEILPGATHYFDNPEYGDGALFAEAVNMEKTPPRGAYLAFDRGATEAAMAQVKDFLDRHLD